MEERSVGFGNCWLKYVDHFVHCVPLSSQGVGGIVFAFDMFEANVILAEDLYVSGLAFCDDPLCQQLGDCYIVTMTISG